MHLKMSSAKWRPFCLGLNVLIERDLVVTLSHLFILLTTDTPHLARKDEIWGVFCEYKAWFRLYIYNCGFICNVELSLVVL